MSFAERTLRAPRRTEKHLENVIVAPPVAKVANYLTEDNSFLEAVRVSPSDTETFRSLEKYLSHSLLPVELTSRDMEAYCLLPKEYEEGPLAGELFIHRHWNGINGDPGWLFMMNADVGSRKDSVRLEYVLRQGRRVDVVSIEGEVSSRGVKIANTVRIPLLLGGLPKQYNPNDLFKDNIPPVLQDHPYLEVARVFAGKRFE